MASFALELDGGEAFVFPFGTGSFALAAGEVVAVSLDTGTGGFVSAGVLVDFESAPTFGATDLLSPAAAVLSASLPGN